MTINEQLDIVDRRNLKGMLLLIAILLGVNAIVYDYWSMYFSDPVPATETQWDKLATAKKAPKKPWIYTPEKILNTGIVQESDRRVSKRYYLIPTGQRYILLTTRRVVTAESMENMSLSFEDLSSFEQSVVSSLIEDGVVAKGKVLAFGVEDTDTFKNGGLITLWIESILLALFLGVAVYLFYRIGDYRKHAVYRMLKCTGDADKAWAKLNAEWMRPEQSHPESRSSSKLGKVRYLPSFLIWQAPLQLQVIPLDEVVWVHIRTMTTNFVARTTFLVFHLSSGKSITISTSFWSQKAPNEIMDSIHKARPWILMGYQKELVQAWRKDKKAVIGAVRAARQQKAAS